MKIALIAPGAQKNRLNWWQVKFGMNLHPKYGLLLLGSYALDLGHDVKYIDEAFEDVPFDADYDLVGITCTTNKAIRAYKIADEFRAKGIQVILGGIHPTVCQAEAENHADSVVIGEADSVWPTILKDAELRQLKPIYEAVGDPFNLKNLPAIRYDLIPSSVKYRHPGAMEVSRGCPYDCEFCSTHFFGKRYRLRPIKDVLENISLIPDNYIIFMDDNLMGNMTYALQLFDAMRDLGKVWTGHATIDIVKHPKLLQAIAQSGCRNLVIGFDTLNDDNLKMSGKGINRGISYDQAVDQIYETGVDIMASFILGFDHDTENTFEEIFNFVTRKRFFLPTYWILTPYPGTQLYNRLKDEGRILTNNWDLYDSRHLVFKPQLIEPKRFMECFEWLERHSFSFSNILHRSKKPGDSSFNHRRKLKFNIGLKTIRSLGMENYGG